MGLFGFKWHDFLQAKRFRLFSIQWPCLKNTVSVVENTVSVIENNVSKIENNVSLIEEKGFQAAVFLSLREQRAVHMANAVMNAEFADTYFHSHPNALEVANQHGYTAARTLKYSLLDIHHLVNHLMNVPRMLAANAADFYGVAFDAFKIEEQRLMR